MITSGFTNAPVSRFLVFSTIVTALAVSLTDSRHYLPIAVLPHIWRYGQFWRLFTWQLSYTNSTEVLFASMTFYQLRVVERLWGSRKFASFIIATFPYTTLLPPLVLTFVIRPLTFGRINYLPAGPSAILFALLAQYYAAIPYTYRYRITPVTASSSGSPSSSGTTNNAPITTVWNRSITLTSKSVSYLLPLQLSLSQLPGSLIAAAIGWAVGTAYRRDMLPYASSWRVPAWMVGEEEKAREFEGLRRRLDAERESGGGGFGLASGILAEEGGGGVNRRGAAAAAAAAGGAGGRRTLGEMVAEQFRGRG